MSFSLRADRSLIRTGVKSRRYLRVALRAPEAPRGDRLVVNLGLVLDRSGSMDGQKIEQAREAVLRAIQCLRPEDRFSVVAYDDMVEVVMPSCHATEEARSEAERRVREIAPGDSTDLCGGWLRGCEQVALHLDGRALGRCLLLTDGLANHGVTNHGEIVRHVSALRERGVATTAFGVGTDFDETLLRRMAEAGGGNFYFIETSAQIPDFLAGEVGDVLQVTAPEAALVVDASEGMVVRSLNGFACRRQPGGWRVELGSLLSGQEAEPILILDFPPGRSGAASAVRVGWCDRNGTLASPQSAIFYHASDEDNDMQARDRSVDRRVAVLYAARAEREALELNGEGEYEQARAALAACRRRIAEYAGDDADIHAVMAGLDRAAQRCAVAMTSVMRKAAYTASDATIRDATLRPRTLG